MTDPTDATQHACGVRTRSGQPCRNPTTNETCPLHDPERTCGAPNGRGGTCRRLAVPGRRCELHDELAIAQREADARHRRDEADRYRESADADELARQVEADALVATLGGCVECLSATLRALVLVEPGDPFDDEIPTPMSLAWPFVVEHLRNGHALVTR